MRKHVNSIVLKKYSKKTVILRNKKVEQLKATKIVIDTNLLVAAFFNKNSNSFKILKMARARKVRLLWTEKIRKEAQLILGNIKKAVKPKMGNRDILKNIFQKENKVKNPPRLDIIKEDPEDNKFLSCALKGGAEIIVSNDRHLLDVNEFKRIPVLTPAQAVKKLQRTSL